MPCPLKTNIQALIFLAGFGCFKEEVVGEKTDKKSFFIPNIAHKLYT